MYDWVCSHEFGFIYFYYLMHRSNLNEKNGHEQNEAFLKQQLPNSSFFGIVVTNPKRTKLGKKTGKESHAVSIHIEY